MKYGVQKGKRGKSAVCSDRQLGLGAANQKAKNAPNLV